MVIFKKYFLFWVLLGLEREFKLFPIFLYTHSFNLLNMLSTYIPLNVYCFFQVENEYHGIFILCENIIVPKIPKFLVVSFYLN